jgi:hypothetical protein
MVSAKNSTKGTATANSKRRLTDGGERAISA